MNIYAVTNTVMHHYNINIISVRWSQKIIMIGKLNHDDQVKTVNVSLFGTTLCMYVNTATEQFNTQTIMI